MEWKIVTKQIKDLKPFGSNPRVFTKKGLADLTKSISRYGLAEPLTINIDNTLIGGNARYTVLKEKGIKECECYMPSRELTLKEVKELNVRLNKNIAGEWDYDILAEEFGALDLLEWGFEEKELDNRIEMLQGELNNKNNQLSRGQVSGVTIVNIGDFVGYARESDYREVSANLMRKFGTEENENVVAFLEWLKKLL